MSTTIAESPVKKLFDCGRTPLPSTSRNPNSVTKFSRTAAWDLCAGFASETGHRSANEDCGYANVREGLFLVADGVGGSYGGAVASHLLVDTIPPLLLRILQDSNVNDDELPCFMQAAVFAARQAMCEMASGNSRLAEMGSTIAFGLIAGQSLLLSHVGDSRAYLVRDGMLKQLTKDHSLVQAFVDAGCLTKEQAKKHPYRHVITESISPKHESPVVVSTHELLPGDRLLFATDGLTDVVDDDVIAWLITNSANPQDTANFLVRQSLDSGARDNITCLVVHVY
jgi:serine/threonine protein phosphatase PrpC